MLNTIDGDRFHNMVARIESALGKDSTDGRLAIEYAVSLICAEEVCSLVYTYVHCRAH